MKHFLPLVLVFVLVACGVQLYAQCSNPTPGPISGPPSVCRGMTEIEYSIAALPGANAYSWVITSGTGVTKTDNGRFVTLSFSNSFTNCTLMVYAVFGPCGTSPTRSMNISVGGIMPGTPGIISGSPSALPGQGGRTYSVSAVSNAVSYEWVLPAGATITSGADTRNITVLYPPTFVSGEVKVRAKSTSCTGSYSPVLAISRLPAPAAYVSGSPPCLNGADAYRTFTVPPIDNADPLGYRWSISPGIAPSGDTRHNSLQFYFPANMTQTTATIGVRGSNVYGEGLPASITIPIFRPAGAAGAISGPANICAGATNVEYSIPPIQNAESYNWIVPPGVTRTDMGTTCRMSFPANFVSGIIRVFGSSGTCGIGQESTLTVTASPLVTESRAITGNSLVCPNETGVIYTVDPIPNATGYSWSVPAGATITSGQNTNTITVNFAASAESGNVSVHGTSCNSNGPSSSIPINIVPASKVNENRSSYAVDHVTGTVNVSIPLFNIIDGEVSVPGTLNYVASGVLVTSDEGWTGQNWNLSVNTWMVSRQVRGLPDDYYGSEPDMRRGWLHNSSVRTSIKNKIFDTDNDPATCADEYANYSFLNGFDYNTDTEPDVFHVSAPGLSFDFYYDENGIPRTVPYQPLSITTSSTANITSFTVTDEKGFEYEFSAQETVTQTLAGPNDFFLVRRSHQYEQSITYTTGWRLTRISGPNYGNVTFSYRTLNTSHDAFYPAYIRRLHAYKYQYPIKFTDKNDVENTSVDFGYNSTIQILTGIETATGSVSFTSAPRNSNTNLERLSAIRIYDNRLLTSLLSKEILLGYTSAQRALLASVTERTNCVQQQYNLEYYHGALPSYEAADKDDWDFYLDNSGSYIYSQTLPSGSLQRIIYPGKGYTAFFYEPHEFFNGTNTVQAAGMRVRKIITYNGGGGYDFKQEFEYKREDGVTSGRLQGLAFSQFEVAVRKDVFGTFNTYTHRTPFAPPGVIPIQFTMKASEDLTFPDLLHGSAVGYERVIVKTSGAGSTIYEYDLPASYGDVTANDNEWMVSRSYVARSSTGTSACYEHPDITMSDGVDHYPFPPNPNYDFARGLLKKVTDYYSNTKVREKTYTYQRLFAPGLSGIRKIYGLSLEEMPTYYYAGGTHHDAKMFAFSKYEIFTDVSTVISAETETLYHSSDLTRKTVSTVNYHYESQNHQQVTRVVTQNSDGSQSISRFKYAADYAVSSIGTSESAAIHNLKSNGRNVLVETVSSVIAGSQEKYTGAALNTFQVISGKVYPHSRYTFVSDGSSTFTPSSSNGTNLIFDQTNYILDQVFLSFDTYGNLAEVRGRDRQVSSVIYEYAGTLPVFRVAGAALSEVRFSNFDVYLHSGNTIQFNTNFSPAFSPGRTGSHSIRLNAGTSSTNNLYCNNVSRTNLTSAVTFSFWINASSPGELTLQFSKGTVLNTTTVPFEGSGTWKFYSTTVDATDFPANFDFRIYTSSPILIDDPILRPSHTDVSTHTYRIPFGKTSDTDSRGVTVFYDYDPAGRLLAVYDQDRNMIKKYDYQTRP